MKNKIIISLLLILIFSAFSCYCAKSRIYPEYKVLKVIEADKFYIDLNKNNAIDDNELVKLKGVSAFHPVLSDYTRKTAKNLNIDISKYLKSGYLARTWAKEELEGKNIKLITKLTIDNKKDNFYLADISYGSENLAIFLLKNGLGYLYDEYRSDYIQYQNFNQIKKNMDKISGVKFLLLNLKTNTIHKPDCKYGVKTAYGELFLEKELKGKNIKNCNYCLNALKNYFIDEVKIPKSKGVYKKSLYRKFDNIELYLINPLEFQKPDPDCNSGICKRIVSEINSAKDSIDLALYGFGGQKEIFNSIKQAKMRGVKIRSVMNYNSDTDSVYSNSLSFINEFNSITNNSNILAHNKFFIFDNKKVLTGSMNISSTGSGGYNANIAAVIDNEEIAKIYKNEFEQMYEGKFSKNKKCFEKSQIIINNSIVKIGFSPKDDVYNTLIAPEIKNAKKEIYISIFYLTDKNFVDELINAKKRGVEVLILSDAVSANKFREKISILRRENIPVIVENWGGKNHEKTILVDNQILIFGSCNFTNSGFNKNDENVVVIKNPEIGNFYKDYFLYLFNSIDKKYLYDMPKAEGFDSNNSCWDGIDNDFDGKIDIEDEGCVKK